MNNLLHELVKFSGWNMDEIVWIRMKLVLQTKRTDHCERICNRFERQIVRDAYFFFMNPLKKHSGTDVSQYSRYTYNRWQIFQGDRNWRLSYALLSSLDMRRFKIKKEMFNIWQKFYVQAKVIHVIQINLHSISIYLSGKTPIGFWNQFPGNIYNY